MFRSDFPIFADQTLCFLDSAASSQKPEVVLSAMEEFYRESYSNVHRGVYSLSERATERYENARRTIQRFISARRAEEIVFTKSTTEAINLVAASYGRMLEKGAQLLVGLHEHHSNLVPWQCISEQYGLSIDYIALDRFGRLSVDDLLSKLGPQTALVAVSSISNVTGLLSPLPGIIAACHAAGAKVLVDAAQEVAHRSIDVRTLDADFLAFSGHKMYGPMGIGVLYGKYDLLCEMSPLLGGGGSIESVSIEKTTFLPPPARFEAGTPNVGGAIGLDSAVSYIERLGFDVIEERERILIGRLEEVLTANPKIEVIGPIGEHHGLISFTLKGVHPHDVAQFLSGRGIAVRAGYHCAQPLFSALGIDGAVRASIGIYNTIEDVERLGLALEDATNFFGV